jgi:hypothetical protein
MPIEMEVRGMILDPSLNRFVVVLCDLENTFSLPIWMGPSEALIIALKQKGVDAHRPMTHDLIRNIVGLFQSRIIKVEVMDFEDSVCYAVIHIGGDGREFTIDARPSDAIAIALAAGAPIFVAEKVLFKAKMIGLQRDMSDDQMKAFLENLDSEDFTCKA